MSSQRWLNRQFRDQFVKQRGEYRSRAAYKLLNLQQRFNLFKPGDVCVDLGAAPGSWSQVAVESGCRVFALDLLPIQPIPGVKITRGDFFNPAVLQMLKQDAGRVNVMLSDLSFNLSGNLVVLTNTGLWGGKARKVEIMTFP